MLNIFKKSAVIILSASVLLTGCGMDIADTLEQFGFSSPVPESSVSEAESIPETSEITTSTTAKTTTTQKTTKATTKNTPATTTAVNNNTDNYADIINSDLYNGILESLENMTMLSEHNNKVDIADVSRVIEMIDITHPEYFWLSSYTVTNHLRSAEVEMDIMNGYSVTELEIMMKELEEAGDRIISSMPDFSDDYSKILFVHDYIVNNTTYGNNGIISDNREIFNTAYGCLVQGTAVCQGYAAAFQYIMNRLGIECGICRGTAGNEAHAWNYVKVDGKYYWIDVTWDDPVPDYGKNETLKHTYFLIDDERMFKTRTVNDDSLFVPECSSMDCNYFVKNGTYITEYNPAQLREIFDENKEAGTVEMMFADGDLYETVFGKLFDYGYIWNMIDSDETIYYSEDDDMYILTIDY